MEENCIRNKKIQRFIRFYPWYAGFSSDLLFWIAVDTLFLQITKGFHISQIVLTTTVSHIAGIVLQIPLMTVVRKLGNTNSVRIGALIDLLAALALTFGNSFLIIVVGRCLHEVSFSFKSMINVTLEHNLELQDKQSEYIKRSTTATTIYSVTTMLISLVASFMFNFNNYLPMMCCIGFCVLCLFLSFYMVDYSENNEEKGKTTERVKVKVKYAKIIMLLLISFSFGYSIVNTGQENAKLFIQNELLNNFSNNKTSVIVGVVLFISRIARVVANLFFTKFHNKMGDKVGVLLCSLILSAFLLLIFGYTLKDLLIVKHTIMTLGYIIILFLRDPFKIYIYNLTLLNSDKEQHSQIMMMLELSRKILTAVISLSFSAVLSSNPMILVIVLYAALGLMELSIGIYLYRFVTKPKELVKEKKYAK